MNKENLIKAINESPNFYGEIQKLINYRIINYDDLLTKEEQENLETLFGFEITEYAEVNLEDREYPRFPLFVKIQKILNENNINLSDYNLEDDEVKIKLLDQLFKIVQEKQEISVFTPRILFEIFGALLGIYKSAGRLNDLLPYTESYLDFICKLYEKTKHDLFFKYYYNLLRIIARDYKEADRIEDLTNAFDKFSKFFSEKVKDDKDISVYLVYLATLIEVLVLKDRTELVNKYLKEFVQFLDFHLSRTYHSFLPVIKGLAALTPVMLIIKPDEETKKLLNSLSKLVEDIVIDIGNFPVLHNDLYLTLALINYAEGNIEKTKDYLILEAKNVEKNKIKRDLFNYYEIVDLITGLSNLIERREFITFLKEVYNYQPGDDFAFHISQGFQQRILKVYLCIGYTNNGLCSIINVWLNGAN